MGFLQNLRLRLFIAMNGSRILDGASKDLLASWPMIEKAFQTSSTVHVAERHQEHTPFQLVLLRSIVENAADAEEVLRENVDNRSAVVAAYCLAGLQMLNSEHLQHISEEVRSREEIVHWAAGAMGMHITLGELAALISDGMSNDQLQKGPSSSIT